MADQQGVRCKRTNLDGRRTSARPDEGRMRSSSARAGTRGRDERYPDAVWWCHVSFDPAAITEYAGREVVLAAAQGRRSGTASLADQLSAAILCGASRLAASWHGRLPAMPTET